MRRPTQQPEPAPTPPPDVAQVVRDAQQKLLAVERSLAVTKDDSAAIFGAMAAFTGVLPVVLDRLAAVEAPISLKDIEQLHKAVKLDAAWQLHQGVREHTKEQSEWRIFLGIVSLFVTLLVGMGIGYLVRPHLIACYPTSKATSTSDVCFYQHHPDH